MKRELETVDAEVLLAAIDCFASTGEAARWLTNPEARFTNGTPIEIASTAGGKERVMSLLLGLIDGTLPLGAAERVDADDLAGTHLD